MTRVGVMTGTRNEVAAGPQRRPGWLAQLWPGGATPSALPALDGLRAVAAVLVMSYHAYHPQHGPIRYTSVFDALSFGNSGVQLFFVLSGFLLGLPYARWLFGLQARPSARLFYERRILRVGPAYWANVIILFLLARWSVSGLLVLLGRIVYLHNVFSNDLTRHAGVLWTMCVEVQFYAVLPLLAGAIALCAKAIFRLTRQSQLALFLAVAFILGGCEALSLLCAQLTAHNRWQSWPLLALAPDALFDPNSMPYWLGVFAVGMGCSFLYVWTTQVRKLSGSQLRVSRALASLAFAGGVLLTLGLALSPLVHIHVPDVDLAFGGVYGLVLIGLTLGASVLRLLFESRAMRFVGYISYSLYLWHLIVLDRLVLPNLSTLTDPHTHMVVAFALDAAISIPLAYVSFLLTERPFFSLRSRAREKPALTPTSAAAASYPAMGAEAHQHVAPRGGSGGSGGSGVPSSGLFAPRSPADSEANYSLPRAQRLTAAQPGHVGQVVGGYRLVRQLGESPHGVSFYAQRLSAELVTWGDAMTSDTVVMKILWPRSGSVTNLHSSEFQQRFSRLALDLQTVCGILIPSAEDAGVAQFISWDGSAQQPYLIRAFIPGYSLAARMAHAPRGLPLAEVASYVARIAAALDYAHARDVTHGACALENVLIAQDGHLTVTDFGLEGLLAPLSGRQPAPSRLELARYWSPERFRNPEQVTSGGDIYSLGVTLHVLLSGAFPFDGATAEELRKAQRSEQRAPLSTYRPDITADIEDVVLRALALRPQNRFASAGELATAFTAAAGRATREKPYTEPPYQFGRERPMSQSLFSQQAEQGRYGPSRFSSLDPRVDG